MRLENQLLRNFVYFICASGSAYYLYLFFTGRYTPMQSMGPLVMIGFLVSFLTYPISKRLPFRIGLAIDSFLAVLSIMSVGYLMIVEDQI